MTYYQKNRIKILKQVKNRTEKNKEKYLEYQTEYRKKNRNKLLEYFKNRWINNKEDYKKKYKIYRKENADKIIDKLRDIDPEKLREPFNI